MAKGFPVYRLKIRHGYYYSDKGEAIPYKGLNYRVIFILVQNRATVVVTDAGKRDSIYNSLKKGGKTFNALKDWRNKL